MKIDLNRIPFSRRNSYMAISELKPEYATQELDAGLYLRTVHGSAERSIVAKLTPLFGGKEEAYSTELELTSLVLRHGDQHIDIVLDDDTTMLVRGSEGTGMKIDFMTEKYTNDYIYDIKHRTYTLYMANCYKNNCRYLIWALKDKISLDQKWNDNIAEYSRLDVSSPDGFMFAIKEVETEWSNKLGKYDFAMSRTGSQEDFLEFLRAVPSYPLEYQEQAYIAAYLEWSSLVHKSGFLTRDTMLVSKNWLADKTGWNHAFNALALSYKEPKLAWDQFILMFDQMDKSGRLPDSFNDSYIKWNHCKPPVHGLILSKMMENMELTNDQLIEAYLVLKRATTWWIKYRDFRHEGLFIYDHAKDSGWDNTTVFSLFPPVATPELQALLIIQMDMVAKISGMLGIEEDAAYWTKQSDKLLNLFLEKCFRDDLPVPIHSNTQDFVECGSLLPYNVLLLGDKLPEKYRKAAVDMLKSDAFTTPYGFATESTKSPLYQSSMKWRGPIWAPATLMILEGLCRSGEKEFAAEQAKKYVNLVQEKGLAENYDAMTGNPIGPNIYTWTASAYLVILHDFLG
ncbi:MAG: glycogen debranching protein [Blautia sp.]|nr:glycogen debranching protein [Blautia sp.]